MRKFSLAFALIVLAGCRTESEPYKYSGGDGSSRDQAVVIKARDEGLGVAAELIWLKDNYTGWEQLTNRFEAAGPSVFKVVTLARTNGERKLVWFDVTGVLDKARSHAH